MSVLNQESLLELVNTLGILPFFKNSVPMWSLEEQCDPTVWFTDQDGPWEWKGRMAASKSCVYGKFVRNGNAWVSLDCFPDLVNLRRNGYDFEGMVDDGLVPYRDKLLMEYLTKNAPVQSRFAKRECGFTKGYDTSLTRLQMQTFVINQDFVYNIDKTGKPYGWGNALLTLPERWLGEDYVNSADSKTPEESLNSLCEHLHKGMPNISIEIFRSMLKY